MKTAVRAPWIPLQRIEPLCRLPVAAEDYLPEPFRVTACVDEFRGGWLFVESQVMAFNKSGLCSYAEVARVGTAIGYIQIERVAYLVRYL